MVNCRQCRQNLEEDELAPECDTCPIEGWDLLTRQLLALHDRCCPWGELLMGAVPQAMIDMEIAPGDRRLARSCLLSIHRAIKHHQHQQTATP